MQILYHPFSRFLGISRNFFFYFLVALFSVELPLYSFARVEGASNSDAQAMVLQSLHSEKIIQLSLTENPKPPSDTSTPTSSQRSTLQDSSLDHLQEEALKIHDLAQLCPKKKAAPPSTPPAQTCRHILVVEDALSSQKMLVRLLQRAGCTCVAANNGQEAVDAVQATLDYTGEDDLEEGTPKPFDTILMDFEMPVLNGPGKILVEISSPLCDLQFVSHSYLACFRRH